MKRNADIGLFTEPSTLNAEPVNAYVNDLSSNHKRFIGPFSSVTSDAFPQTATTHMSPWRWIEMTDRHLNRLNWHRNDKRHPA